MARGNIYDGLLADMIEVMNDLGADRFYGRDEIVAELKKRGWWADGETEAPPQTVNSYFSDNPDIFHRGQPGEYRLQIKHHRIPIHTDGAAMSGEEAIESISRLIIAAVYRERARVMGASGDEGDAILGTAISQAFEGLAGRKPKDHEIGRIVSREA